MATLPLRSSRVLRSRSTGFEVGRRDFARRCRATAAPCVQHRSPHRPNPIGLHRVEVASIDGARIRMHNLEAVEGTPILDVKAVLASAIGER